MATTDNGDGGVVAGKTTNLDIEFLFNLGINVDLDPLLLDILPCPFHVGGLKIAKNLQSVLRFSDKRTQRNGDELEFILEAAKMNREASLQSQKQKYGHDVAKSLMGERGRAIFGENIHSRMISATAGACDARMDGALIPVMSNSGSGNQGVAATLPVLTYAEDVGSDRESLIRALILSNLTVIHIKQYLGRLSALCGCVVASAGSSCGITYLMGGNYDQITFAVKNMIANITGMICDGAKPSCALKIASGTSTAMLSALMAIENRVVTPHEGIVNEDVDKTIQNLAIIGRQGMAETDRIVLKVMTHKA
jgi:L-cysteine desulfidase